MKKKENLLKNAKKIECSKDIIETLKKYNEEFSELLRENLLTQNSELLNKIHNKSYSDEMKRFFLEKIKENERLLCEDYQTSFYKFFEFYSFKDFIKNDVQDKRLCLSFAQNNFYKFIIDMKNLNFIFPEFKHKNCSECGCSEFDSVESLFQCKKCGFCVEMDSYSMWKHIQKEKSQTTILPNSNILEKNIKQKLMEICGEGIGKIPGEHLDLIIKKLKSEHYLDVQNISKLNKVTIRHVMKKLGLEDYYKQDEAIINFINNNQRFQMNEIIFKSLVKIIMKIKLHFNQSKNLIHSKTPSIENILWAVSELINYPQIKEVIKSPKFDQKQLILQKNFEICFTELGWLKPNS